MRVCVTIACIMFCALLGEAVPVFGQTPCVENIPATITVDQPGVKTFSVCTHETDTAGAPLAITGVEVRVNGTPFQSTTPPTRFPPTNLVEFTLPIPLAAGTHDVSVMASANGALSLAVTTRVQVAGVTLTPSPNGTKIPTATQIIDTTLKTWTLSPATPAPAVLRDGIHMNGGTVFAYAIKFWDGAIYVWGDDKAEWWKWDDATNFVSVGATEPGLSVPPPPVPCTFTLNPAAVSFNTGAAQTSVMISASASTCAWSLAITAGSPTTWLTVVPASGTGNGVLMLTALANTAQTVRAATFAVGNAVLQVSQAAAPAPPPPPPPTTCSTLPQINRVISYSNRLSLGEEGIAVFTMIIPAGRKIVNVTADLVGDGEPGWPIALADGVNIRGIAYKGTKRGTFNLVIAATDSAGCTGQTGVARSVRIQ